MSAVVAGVIITFERIVSCVQDVSLQNCTPYDSVPQAVAGVALTALALGSFYIASKFSAKPARNARVGSTQPSAKKVNHLSFEGLPRSYSLTNKL